MGGSFLSPDKRDCLLIPSQLSAVLKQVVACFRTCLTKNGSQRGRAPAGQRPQPPSGGAWPRPATQHRPPPLAGAPLVAPVRESANGILVNLVALEPAVFTNAKLTAHCALGAGTPPALTFMKPDWLMINSAPWVPNGTQGSGIHFQHPDQPLPRLLFRRPTR